MKVKDLNGNYLAGLERNSTGALIVNDEKSYIKYIHEQEKSNRIKDLEDRLSKMESVLNKLLQEK